MPRRDLSRKAPKRAPAKPRLDADLAELALMLDEQRLDRCAAGWFSVPWLDGWNAVRLAFDAAGATNEVASELVWIGEWITRTVISADAYWIAGDALESKTLARFTRAAMRAYQVLVAHSDAGGEAYNQILAPVFEIHPPERFVEMITHHRMHDALGDDARNNQRRASAFMIAWRRGLYKAAYAL